MRIDFKQFTLMKTYTVWVIVLTVFTIVSMLTGTYQELMSQAVEKVIHTSTSGISSEQMRVGFIIISMIVAFITIGVGYFLVIFSTKGKRWAQWLFLCFCLWQVKSAVWDSFKLSQMYPNVSYSLIEHVGGILHLCMLIILIIKTISLIKEKNPT